MRACASGLLSIATTPPWPSVALTNASLKAAAPAPDSQAVQRGGGSVYMAVRAQGKSQGLFPDQFSRTSLIASPLLLKAMVGLKECDGSRTADFCPRIVANRHTAHTASTKVRR